MRLKEQNESITVSLTGKDIRDIEALRNSSVYEPRSNDSINFYETIFRKGIQKFREEQAAETYGALSVDEEYIKYHNHRRANRRKR